MAEKAAALQTPTMDIRTAFNQIRYVDFPAGNAVCMQSDPGFGKSMRTVNELYPALVQDWIAELGGTEDDYGLCIDYIGNKESSADAMGLQFRGTRTFGEGDNKRVYTVTDPAMPMWYICTDGKPACEKKRVLLVLEEWGQGDIAVKKAYAPVIWDHGVGVWYLPDGSNVLVLTNIDSRDGVTKELDMTINRMMYKKLHNDFSVWDEDFAAKPYIHNGRQWTVSALTRSWGHENQTVICEPKPQVQGPWCTYRSATNNDRCMQLEKARNNGELPIHDGSFIAGVSGRIGAGACNSLMAHAEFELHLPKYEDVVNDPEGTEVPKKADLILLMTYKMGDMTKQEHVPQCIKYMMRFPPEMGIAYVKGMVHKNPAIVRHPSMQGWIAANSHIMTILQAMQR